MCNSCFGFYPWNNPLYKLSDKSDGTPCIMYCNLISFQLLIVHNPDFATKGNFRCTIHFTNTIANERHFVTIVCFMLWVEGL